MSTLIIRKAVENDRKAILEVTLSAYKEYAAIMPAEHWKVYQANIHSTLADISPAEQFVAELDGVVVGSVLLYPSGMETIDADGSQSKLNWPGIRLLAVLPEARRRGVGRALMDACIDRADKAGLQAITLHTHETMAAAVRLYERIGFERAPELDLSPVEGVVIKGYRYIIGAENLP